MNFKARINKRALGAGCILWLIVIFWHHFFYIFPFSDSINIFLKIENLMLVIAGLALIYYFVIFVFQEKIKNKYRSLMRYMTGLLITIILISAYSYIKYPQQPLVSTLRGAAGFIIPFCAFFVIMYLEKGGEISKVFAIMNFCAVLWYITILTQILYYQINNEFYFDFQTYMKQYFNKREYGLRINLHVFGNIMILYNMIKFKYAKEIFNKVLHFVYMLLGMICMVFIQQTRAILVYVAICVFVWIFLFSDKSRKTRIIQMLVLISVVYIVCFTNIVSSFYSSFSMKGENAYSTTARLYGIQYYLDCFRKNPLFGNGFADGGGHIYRAIEHGSKGSAFYSDLGFIGLLANIGLGSIVVFIIPLVRMILIWRRNRMKLDYVTRDFLLIMVVYFIVTSVTYIVLPYRNVLLFAFAIGLFEYIDVKNFSSEKQMPKETV